MTDVTSTVHAQCKSAAGGWIRYTAR